MGRQPFPICPWYESPSYQRHAELFGDRRRHALDELLERSSKAAGDTRFVVVPVAARLTFEVFDQPADRVRTLLGIEASDRACGVDEHRPRRLGTSAKDVAGDARPYCKDRIGDRTIPRAVSAHLPQAAGLKTCRRKRTQQCRAP